MNTRPARRHFGPRLPPEEKARRLPGRGTFVDDIALPGMLHVAFVRSPIAAGHIKSIDTSLARDIPGVHSVFTAADFAPFKVNMLSFFLGMPAFAVPLLATDKVTYVGDPVAMVIASNRYLAEDAAGAVFVEYEEEQPV